jgi:uncharacterized cofD-like protein
MVDDGGSTGILRDEFGVLPPGDVRQCLVALSESTNTMRELFSYRFEGETFGGHSFGNLFLTVLEKTTGSFADAVKTASKVLNIVGQVIPVTLVNCNLVLTKVDGTRIVGEYAIGSTGSWQNSPNLSIEPNADLNPEAKTALLEADLIVIAPGNLYTSLIPTLLTHNLKEALAESTAPIVYVCNLVTKPGQTGDFKVHDFAREIIRYSGRLDVVIYNHRKPSKLLLDKYAHDGEFGVIYDREILDHEPYRAIAGDLVSDTIASINQADSIIPRTLIRHNGEVLAQLIMSLLDKR